MTAAADHLRDVQRQFADVALPSLRRVHGHVRAVAARGAMPSAGLLAELADACRACNALDREIAAARREYELEKEAEWLAGRCDPDGRPRSELMPR